MARIERATSPLPRECSTTEPHGPSTQCRHRPGGCTCNHQASADGSTGAGDGNRTRIISLEGWGSTIELLPPGSLRGAFPVGAEYRHQPQVWLRHDLSTGQSSLKSRLGGGGWIRTTVGVSQQIYSLPPLATRAPLHAEPVMVTQDVPRLWRRPSVPTLCSERPPVHEVGRLHEVAAFSHEFALQVIGWVASLAALAPQPADGHARSKNCCALSPHSRNTGGCSSRHRMNTISDVSACQPQSR